jgi:hypothetical protein
VSVTSVAAFVLMAFSLVIGAALVVAAVVGGAYTVLHIAGML